MRFQQHINEAKTPSVQVLLDMIYSSCQPFLKESKIPKNPEQMCYSGRKNKTEKFFIGRIRKDRLPRDSNQSLHNKYDGLFQEKFGWKARSEALFCSGSMSKAAAYGEPYMIFPVGKYKYIWSPRVADIFTWIELGHSYWRDFRSPEDADRWAMKTYTDKDLPKALKSKNEIMIGGNQYIAVDRDPYWHLFKAYWKVNGNKPPTNTNIAKAENKMDMFNNTGVEYYSTQKKFEGT